MWDEFLKIVPIKKRLVSKTIQKEVYSIAEQDPAGSNLYQREARKAELVRGGVFLPAAGKL